MIDDLPNTGIEQAIAAAATTGAAPNLSPLLATGIAVLTLAVGLALLIRGRSDDTTDSTTGLMSRRRFDLDLDERERRGAQPTAMLMIDIDGFADIDDDHGRDVGDDVLRKVGAAIGAHIRADDVAYRYGHDEFSVLLPDTDQATATAVAERIREAISAIDAPVRGLITASVGVACGPASDASTIVADADAALNEAKNAGRNRVAIA